MIAMLGACLAGTANATATITIQVMDAVNTGFHDPTPITPIGGNSATTLGAARLNVFKEAARLWGALINSPVPIVVEARFAPIPSLSCNATTGALGSAGPTWIFHDFPNAPLPNVFYPAALADALAGHNISGKDANGNPYGDTHITASFNGDVNGNANCLGGSYFYYGFDHQLTGHNDGRRYVADLLGVVLHELGHGLGFVSIVNPDGTGVKSVADGITRLGVFEQYAYEESVGMFWSQMTPAQRVQSATGQPVSGPTVTGTAALVWNAPLVNTHLARLSLGTSVGGHLKLFSPATYDVSSSVSHWDSSATPDLLMESRYSTATGNHTDMTTCALYDMGWTGDRCPDGVNAAAQSANVTTNTAATITLIANDGDGDALTYAIVSAPLHGSLGALNGSTVTYTPSAGYIGADQFTFSARDAVVSSNTATVTLAVAAATGGGTGSGTGAGTGGGITGATAHSGGGGAMPLWSLLALAFWAIGAGRQRRQSGLEQHSQF